MPSMMSPMRLGQTTSQNIQPYRTAMKMPRTLMPTGVSGSIAGTNRKKQKMMSSVINV